GDSYLPCSYQDVAAHFERSGKQGLMTVCRNEGKWDTSNVEFDGLRIINYDKTLRTPHMRHIDYGLGAFRRAGFEHLPDGFLSLETVYKGLLDRDQLAAFEIQGRFYEIGSPQGIEDLAALLNRGSA